MQRQTRKNNLERDVENPLKGYEDRQDPKYGNKQLMSKYKSLLTMVGGMSFLGFIWFLQITSPVETPSSSDVSEPYVELPVKSAEPVFTQHIPETEPSKDVEDLAELGDSLTTFLDEEESELIGYVRLPTKQGDFIDETEEDRRLHIIFSSGCNYFQHWQSELLLSSAKQISQRGRITRIVSGCYDKKAEDVNHKHQTFPKGKNDKLVPLRELNRSTNEAFGLFITPQFEGAIDFPWINKPNSIDYFLNHNPYYSNPDFGSSDDVIVILDPDFIFLKPFLLKPDSEHIIASRGQRIAYVEDGVPIGQRYGLEGGWVSKFSPVDKKITKNPNSLSAKYTYKEAAKHTSVGPPMILTIGDMKNLAKLWKQYMKPVLENEKDILADMWAYSIAAADLDLKHVIHDQYMISTWGHSGQAYKFLDEFQEMSCSAPEGTENMVWPNFIHYASNFKAFIPPEKLTPEELKLTSEKDGWIEYMFHKGHVPGEILDCGTPLIIEPPDELFNWVKKENYEGFKGSETNYQKAWVVCNVLSRLNNMLKEYKSMFCREESVEDRPLIRLIQKKNKDRSCSPRRDKWCYPLAQIEGLDEGWRD
eukprot:maker-scaffold_89-snap-gene-0.10-mRNA-1 protein AED:0.19 eAED:0.19 QI:34/1/1/1/1/1/2/177/589